MRMLIFKVVVFLAIFLLAQAEILPWVISNNSMPLWGDMILVTVIIMVWIAVADRLVDHLLKVLRKKSDEATE